MVRIGHASAMIAAIAATLFFVCASATAGSTVSLHLKRSVPALRATLRSNDTLYLAVDYASDIPLRLQARAYRAGVSVDEGQRMNPSVLHPQGTGHRPRLGWLRQPGDDRRNSRYRL